MPDGHFDPLPEGFSGPGLTRSGKFVDVEILGGLTVGGSITGGTITGGTITGGAISGGTITGTTISGGTIVAADMYSDNWVSGGGAVPLALPDGSATTGYALDASTGIVQAQDIRAKGGTIGGLTIDGTLTFSTGAIFRTAASGTRIELSAGNPAQLFFYRDAETTATAPSVSRTSSSLSFGGGSVGHPSIILYPADEVPAAGYVPYRILLGGSGLNTTIGGILAVQSGSASAPSLAFTADSDTGMYRVGANTIGFTVSAALRLQVDTTGILVGTLGNQTNPAYSFIGDPDSGMYNLGADDVGIVAGGARRLRINATRVGCDNVSFLSLPVKTTTGDPTGAAEGDTYVNTFDNKIRTYADAAWRDLATW